MNLTLLLKKKKIADERKIPKYVKDFLIMLSLIEPKIKMEHNDPKRMSISG